MNPLLSNHRVLDPLERFSEIVFGLIMVLTFTCALGVAEAGREDVREMWVGRSVAISPGGLSTLPSI